MFKYLPNLLLLLALSAPSFAKDTWDGEYYNKHSIPQYQRAKHFFSHYPFKGNEVVLDVGCGNGKITALLSKKVPKGSVIGIDLSPSMIQVAEKSHRLPNLKFKKIDALQLSYQNQFDLITAFSVMHWIKQTDQNKVLKSMQHALKPGGRIFLRIGTISENQVIAAAHTIAKQKRWAPYFNNFEFNMYATSNKRYLKLIKKAGLDLIRLERYEMDEIFADRQHFMDWLTAWLPYAKALPESLTKEFLQEVTRQYLAKHPVDSRGRIHAYNVEIELEAKKHGGNDINSFFQSVSNSFGG